MAKDVLKWNDSCIDLFWELFFQAMIYLDPKFIKYTKEELNTEIECFAIFLILHTVDQSQSKFANSSSSSSSGSNSNNSSTLYDSVWPANCESEIFPTSCVTSPASPVKENSTIRSSSRSPAGSPLSPRSPRHTSNSIQPGSPKRGSLVSTPRTPRGSTHYLHSVRQKVPTILQILNSDYSELNELFDEKKDVLASKKMVDALGLIISGGYSRDQAVIPLSSLHPAWGTESDSSNGKGLKESAESINTDMLISGLEFISWINAHLSMNDVVYPVTVSSNFGSITSPPIKELSNIPGDFDGNKDFRNHQPIKIVNSVASLSRFSPTVICSNNATILHLVGSTSTRTSFRRIGSRSFDMIGTSNSLEKDMKLIHSSRSHPSQVTNTVNCLESWDVADMDNDFSLTAECAIEAESSSSPNSPTNSRSKCFRNRERDGGSFSLETNESNDDNDLSNLDVNLDTKFKDMLLQDPSSSNIPTSNTPFSATFSHSNRPEFALPQLFVNYCFRSHLYLISPYYSASIVGCSNSDIIIGAVYGTIIVSGCDRMKLSGACRKLILVNCVDCEFSIATLSPTIIEGDCRNLIIGPHNLAYRNFLTHLKQTELTSLIGDKNQTSSHVSNVSDTFNQWSKICDINVCFETSSTQSTSNIICENDEPFSQHLSSKVKLMPYSQFRIVSVPNKLEHIPLEVSL